MKKILAILLAMSMMLASTVAFAADPEVAESVNPKLTLIATDIVSMDMEDDLGERLFAVIDVNIELPEGTLSDSISYNNMTKKGTGTGFADFGFRAFFDADLFDMTTSYGMNTEGKGVAQYDPNEKGMISGYNANVACKEMYVGTLVPFCQFYMALEDDTATVDSINASTFATIDLAEVTIETWNSSTAPIYRTKYTSRTAEEDAKKNYDFATQVGNEPELDLEKTVEGGTLDDATKTKTFELTVGADLKDEGVTAVLTHDDHPGDPQEIGLTFTGWAGEAQAVFNVVVHFLNYDASASKVNLTFKD